MVSPASLPSPDLLLAVARVAEPLFVLLAALSIPFLRPPPPPIPSPITPVVVASRVPRRTLIRALLSLVALTYLLDGLVFVLRAVLYKKWPSSPALEINAVAGLVSFAALAVFGTWKEFHGVDVWFRNRVTFAIFTAFALASVHTVLFALRIKSVFTDPTSAPLFVLLHLAFPAVRVLLFVLLLAALYSPVVLYTAVEPNGVVEEVPTDSSALIVPTPRHASATNGAGPSDSTKYGTFRTTASDAHSSTPTTRAPTPFRGDSKYNHVKPEITLEPSWSEIWRRVRRIAPYLWPSEDRYLQLLTALCVVILLLGRVVNFAMPFVLAQLVRIIDHTNGQSPWTLLLVYVALRFLQGSGGLAAVRDALWAPVMQYSDRKMSQLSFDHLLNLSFSWHLRRKTGEVLRVLDRGAVINHALELVLFNLAPTFIDICVALVTFSVVFEWTLTIVIACVMIAYIVASVILTRWRTRIRRQMNERDVITRGIHTDCLLNYETVKYFGGEEHEGERYRDAIRQYQALEFKVMLSLNFLNMVQNAIISLGLLIGSIIVASRVTKGQSDAGDFVYFITYLAQLYGPLNQLGYVYRAMNQSLIDTEKLLDLLNEPTEVNDIPGAPDLMVHDGEIEFDNVNFSYDGRTTALRGVSFKVPKGSSVALVGESGAGKSTILRLLYRFYDLKEGQGRILIDGQDIRDVTQRSLRNAIGVVPQDSVLFNASIAYNIRYGKFGSSSEEIEAAARSAQMHDKIMSFPDGYQTTVGERGVRLSGGEKQRVAIARTLLKNPPVLLLDEATNALDTATEKDIQKALQNLVKGRASLSIAHRLSTIASADLILVFKDGQIVERGTHKELLAQDGLFATMWAEQVSATDKYHITKADADAEAEAEISGYVVDDARTEVDHGENESADPRRDSSVVEPLAGPESEPLSTKPLPPAPIERAVSGQGSIAFPTSDPEVVSSDAEGVNDTAASPPVPKQESEPPTFPSSDEPEPERTATPAPGPAVTFGESVNSPPRIGTPDPDSEPKRKRTASQNFQRLARRISITTRRQSSMIIPSIPIPGLKKSESPRVSLDEGTGGATSNNTDSPAGSVKGDTIKGKIRKDKKDKERKT